MQPSQHLSYIEEPSDEGEHACSWDADVLPTKVLLEAWDHAVTSVGAATRAKLRFIRTACMRELWRDEGCRDMAEYVSGREQVSNYRARRMITAALVLEFLPRLSDALEGGVLCPEKVYEIARSPPGMTRQS